MNKRLTFFPALAIESCCTVNNVLQCSPPPSSGKRKRNNANLSNSWLCWHYYSLAASAHVYIRHLLKFLPRESFNIHQFTFSRAAGKSSDGLSGDLELREENQFCKKYISFPLPISEISLWNLTFTHLDQNIIFFPGHWYSA